MTEQSINDFSNYQFTQLNYREITFGILIIIWFLSSFILTKSFSGLLLNIYFNMKSHSIVNNIEDIIDNKQLSMAGWSLKYLNATKPDEYKILTQRVSEFKKNFKTIFNETIDEEFGWKSFEGKKLTILEQVEKGQTVLYLDSWGSDKIRLTNPGINLVEAEDKYSPNFHTLFISKRNLLYEKIVLS